MMPRIFISIFLLVIGFASLEGIFSKTSAISSTTKTENHTPLIGAIRWDAWFAGNNYERHLAPEKWRHRLPFYARISSNNSVLVRSDSQEVMDKEIAYASGAGLDYWAFCYYRSKKHKSIDSYNYGLKLYLASKHKADIGFCLTLVGYEFLGSKEEWPQTVQQLITYFREPTYQKVQDGRPLVYIFDAHKLAKWTGSDMEAKEAVDYLRKTTVKSGLREPLIVAMAFSAADGARAAELFGLDAIGAYATPEKGEDREFPYSALTKANRGFWENCRATGKQVVPIVNTGWDNRPRRDNPKHAEIFQGPWYTPPTPAELADHLRSAVFWTRSNPDATRADTILIYAWNESDEGGWLVPTHSEGTARLDAIKRVLQKR